MNRTIIALAFASAMLPLTADAKPLAGANELRLGPSGASPFGFVIPSGAFRFNDTSVEDDDFTIIGLQGGFGRFLLDVLEIGITASVETFGFGGDDVTLMGLSPFLKFLYVPASIGFYAELSPGILHVARDDGNTYLGLGFAAGIEGFVTRTWSVRAGPLYRFVGADGESLHIFGIDWGISSYF